MPESYGLSARTPVLEPLETRILLSAQPEGIALPAGMQGEKMELPQPADPGAPRPADDGDAILGSGEIHGSKWYDADQDGQRGDGEPGLPDWEIYLDLNHNGQLDGSGAATRASTDVPRGIHDYTTTLSDLVVSGLAGAVSDVNVTLNITHTYDGDLDVYLIGPSGRSVELFTDVGGWGENFLGTTLDDEASLPITAGSAPFSGSYRPEGLLASFDGEEANGMWTLSVTDDAGGDQGTLNSWSLTLDTREPTAETDASGDYAFTGLSAATYTVREVARAGWTQTFPAGAHSVPLADGQVVEDVDFGNYTPPGRIEGSKWLDADQDGARDTGEPGLQGWKIYVDMDRNGEWSDGEPFDVTDEQGTYAIAGLLPGTYVLAEQLQDGWAQSFPTAAAASALSPALVLADAAGPAVTTDGSKAPLYLAGAGAGDHQGGRIYPATDVSGPLIGMDTFRADGRFAGVDGSGFAVAILDTGIDLNHPFFGPDSDGNGIADRIVYQWDFADGDSDASDANGHGSNVSSIAAGQDPTYTGMAPGADIIHLKVFTDAGGGNFGYLESALQWVAANAEAYNIASVNMSLGDSGNYTSPVGLYGIDDEMAALAAQDVIVVSSSGNSFYEYGGAQGAGYPGADPNSLSIGAVWDGNNGGPFNWSGGAVDYTTGADRVVSFSQRHATMSDVFAPGAFITGAGTSGNTTNYAGTSQAAPHITGIMALCQQLAAERLGRRLTLSEVRGLLSSTSVMIHDGDDEDDNVANTGLDFPRVDMVALGEAILAMGSQGGTHTVVVEAGQTVEDVDFGNFRSAEISGVKWYDADQDGQRDADEPGLAGWRIYADRNGNGQWEDTEPFDLTRGDGSYSLTVTAPGTHTIREQLQPHWSQTFPTGTGAQTVTVSGGDVVSGVDFGNYASGEVRGLKWYDADQDGERDETGEPGLGGWKVYADADANGQWDDGEPFDVTASDGTYALPGLEPGTYAIREELQAGWTQTFPAGAHSVAVGAGELVEGVDFGNYAPNRIQGAKWYDADQDGQRDDGERGLPDWTIYLDLNQNGQLDGGTATRAATDVPKGIYDYTTTTSDLIVSGVGGDVRDVNVTLNITHTWDSDLDVYLIGPSGRSVELFTDVGSSGDGFLDTTLDDEAAGPITFGVPPFTGRYQPEGFLGDFDGEPASGTWTLSVYDDAGGDQGTLNSWSLTLETGEPSTQTGADGQYGFSDLAPGAYTVREVAQPGWTQTFPAGGHSVSLTTGQIVDDVDFGNYAPGGRIEGAKWLDVDADGVRGAGEPGLEGWKVYLDENRNGQWDDGEAFDLSASDGSYAFEGLGPWTHTVAEEQRDGWEQSFPTAGDAAFCAWDYWASSLFLIDGDGNITDMAPAGVDIAGLAYDTADGVLYGISSQSLYSVDLETGSASLIGTVPEVISYGLGYSPLDDLLYSVTSSGDLVQIDPDALTATIVSGPGPGTGAGGVAFRATDGRLYAHSNASPRIYSYDAVTFAGPQTHANPSESPNYGMTFDGTRLVLGPGSGETLYAYDPGTGATTPLFPDDLMGGRGIDALAYIPGGAGAHEVAVQPGQTVANVDFGNHPNSGVSGAKWNDLDEDSDWDGDEPGLGGWKIFLDVDLSGEWEQGEPFAVTGADGGYAIAAPPGSYYVVEEPQPGWTRTFPDFGHAVIVEAGQIVQGINFGNCYRQETPPPGPPDLLPACDTGVHDDDDITRLDNSSTAAALEFLVPETVTGTLVTLYAEGRVIGSALGIGTTTTITTRGTFDLADGPHTITATQQAPDASESHHSPELAITVDTTSPRVAGFGLSSTDAAWALGTVDSPVWTSGRIERTAPWSTIDRLAVTFDEPVTGGSDDMWLSGYVSDVVPLTGPAGAETTRLVWDAAGFLGQDRYVVRVMSGADGVEDLAGNMLDGESHGYAFPSGDGVPGGDWLCHLNVLVGDADGSGQVGMSDNGILRGAYAARIGETRYDALADLDGSGRVDIRDRRLYRANYRNRLPQPSSAGLGLRRFRGGGGTVSTTGQSRALAVPAAARQAGGALGPDPLIDVLARAAVRLSVGR